MERRKFAIILALFAILDSIQKVQSTCDFNAQESGTSCINDVDCGYAEKCVEDQCCPILGIRAQHSLYTSSGADIAVTEAWRPIVSLGAFVIYDMHVQQKLLGVKMATIQVPVMFGGVESCGPGKYSIEVQVKDSITPVGPWISVIDGKNIFEDEIAFGEMAITARFIRISPVQNSSAPFPCIAPSIRIQKGALVGSPTDPLPLAAYLAVDWQAGNGLDQITMNGRGFVPFKDPLDPSNPFVVVDLGISTEISAIAIGSGRTSEDLTCGLDFVQVKGSDNGLDYQLITEQKGPSASNPERGIDIALPPMKSFRYLAFATTISQGNKTCLKLQVYTRDFGKRGQKSAVHCSTTISTVKTIVLKCPSKHHVVIDYVGKVRMTEQTCLKDSYANDFAPTNDDLSAAVSCPEKTAGDLSTICPGIVKDCLVDVTTITFPNYCQENLRNLADQTRIVYHCQPDDIFATMFYRSMKDEQCAAKCEQAIHTNPSFPYQTTYEDYLMYLVWQMQTTPPMWNMNMYPNGTWPPMLYNNTWGPMGPNGTWMSMLPNITLYPPSLNGTWDTMWSNETWMNETWGPMWPGMTGAPWDHMGGYSTWGPMNPMGTWGPMGTGGPMYPSMPLAPNQWECPAANITTECPESQSGNSTSQLECLADCPGAKVTGFGWEDQFKTLNLRGYDITGTLEFPTLLINSCRTIKFMYCAVSSAILNVNIVLNDVLDTLSIPLTPNGCDPLTQYQYSLYNNADKSQLKVTLSGTIDKYSEIYVTDFKIWASPCPTTTTSTSTTTTSNMTYVPTTNLNQTKSWSNVSQLKEMATTMDVESQPPGENLGEGGRGPTNLVTNDPNMASSHQYFETINLIGIRSITGEPSMDPNLGTDPTISINSDAPMDYTATNTMYERRTVAGADQTGNTMDKINSLNPTGDTIDNIHSVVNGGKTGNTIDHSDLNSDLPTGPTMEEMHTMASENKMGNTTGDMNFALSTGHMMNKMHTNARDGEVGNKAETFDPDDMTGPTVEGVDEMATESLMDNTGHSMDPNDMTGPTVEGVDEMATESVMDNTGHSMDPNDMTGPTVEGVDEVATESLMDNTGHSMDPNDMTGPTVEGVDEMATESLIDNTGHSLNPNDVTGPTVEGVDEMATESLMDNTWHSMDPNDMTGPTVEGVDEMATESLIDNTGHSLNPNDVTGPTVEGVDEMATESLMDNTGHSMDPNDMTGPTVEGVDEVATESLMDNTGHSMDPNDMTGPTVEGVDEVATESLMDNTGHSMDPNDMTGPTVEGVDEMATESLIDNTWHSMDPNDMTGPTVEGVDEMTTESLMDNTGHSMDPNDMTGPTVEGVDEMATESLMDNTGHSMDPNDMTGPPFQGVDEMATESLMDNTGHSMDPNDMTGPTVEGIEKKTSATNPNEESTEMSNNLGNAGHTGNPDEEASNNPTLTPNENTDIQNTVNGNNQENDVSTNIPVQNTDGESTVDADNNPNDENTEGPSNGDNNSSIENANFSTDEPNPHTNGDNTNDPNSEDSVNPNNNPVTDSNFESTADSENGNEVNADQTTLAPVTLCQAIITDGFSFADTELSGVATTKCPNSDAQASRPCSNSASWGTIDASACASSVGGSCSNGQKCTNGVCVNGVCAAVCRSTGIWPETVGGRYASVDCDGPGTSMTRLCSTAGKWQTISYAGCLAYANEDCSLGHSCQLVSECIDGKCQCKNDGYEITDAPFGKSGCTLKSVGLNESCTLGQICKFESVCDRVSFGTCVCPETRVAHEGKCELFCSASEIWPKTVAGQTVVQPCANPTTMEQSRECSVDGQWQTSVASNCLSDPNESCASSESCLGGSICIDGTCKCNAGFAVGLDSVTDLLECQPITADIGQSCAAEPEPLCKGGAVCNDESKTCLCEEPMVQKNDICSYKTAGVNSSCGGTAVCVSGATCIQGTCVCPEGTVEYEQEDGTVVCPPDPCPEGSKYVQESNVCLAEGISNMWENGASQCQNMGSSILKPSTETQWEGYQKIRTDANVWIGLRYDWSLQMFIWSDGTTLKLADYTWIPWVDATNPLDISQGTCAASRENNAHKWEFIDCNDETIKTNCVNFNPTCPATGQWPITEIGQSRSKSCANPSESSIQRECKDGGIWTAKDQSQCYSYAGDSCANQQQCQYGSYCTADPETSTIKCKCDSGMELSLMSDGNMGCDNIKAYADESCKEGEECQSGSFCNATAGKICQCTDLNMKVYNASIGKHECHPSCVAEEEWLKTSVGKTVQISCVGGLKTRSCVAKSQWGDIDASQCSVPPGSSCRSQEKCSSLSECSISTGICECPTGYAIYTNDANAISSCSPQKAYLGEDCSNAICQHNSECHPATEICVCPTGQSPLMDDSLNKEVCAPLEASYGDSCANNEACLRSTCDINTRTCSCPQGQIAEVQAGKTVCVPEPCENYQENNNQCMAAQSETAYNLGRDSCNDQGSQYPIIKTLTEWNTFLEMRTTNEISDPRLSNIWIGLSNENSVWVWNDGTPYVHEDWVPWGSFGLPNIDSGLCVFSKKTNSADNSYGWQIGNCNDHTRLALCYKTPDSCPADGEWGETAIKRTKRIICVQGWKQRSCAANAIWNSVTNRECTAPPGMTCSNGETCGGDSTCTPSRDISTGGKVCQCNGGMVIGTEQVCTEPESSPGESCSGVQKCTGDSVCDGLVCICPLGQEPDQNGQCTTVAVPTEACDQHTTCKGGSICDMDICTCPQDKPYNYVEAQGSEGECRPYSQLDEMCNAEEMCNPEILANCTNSKCECSIHSFTRYEAKCIWDFAKIGENCTEHIICHPATNSKCEGDTNNKKCICKAPAFYQKAGDQFDVCRATIRSQYGGQCFADSSEGTICDLDRDLTCVENICKCVQGYSFRRGECMQIGACSDGEMWYEGLRDCAIPKVNEACTSKCQPLTLYECLELTHGNKTCQRPHLGDKCVTANCADDDSFCGPSGICICGVGFTGFNGECVSGHPKAGEPCALQSGGTKLAEEPCFAGSVCNADLQTPMCECPEFQERYAKETCEPKRKKVDESCQNGEICLESSKCIDEICVCPPGSEKLANSNNDGYYCLYASCSAVDTSETVRGNIVIKSWPTTNATFEAKVDCLDSETGPGDKRKCNIDGQWQNVRILCINSQTTVEDLRSVMVSNTGEVDGETFELLLDALVPNKDVIKSDPTEIASWAEIVDDVFALNPALKSNQQFDKATWKRISEKLVIVGDAYADSILPDGENTDKSRVKPAAEFIFDIEGQMQAMLDEYMKIKVKEEINGSIEPTENMKVEFFEIRPGQSASESTSLGEGHCVVPYETLDNPKIVHGKDKFGAVCSIINIRMPVTTNDVPKERHYLKMADQIISLSVGLNLDDSPDFLVYLNFSATDEMGNKTTVENATCLHMKNINANQDEAERYSPVGCKVSEIGHGYVTCACTHTTNYALLMSIPKIREKSKHYDIMKWLSMGLLIVSIIFLTICILVLLYIRNLRTQRIFILRNLCAILLLALIIFLVTIFLPRDPWDTTKLSESRRDTCKVMAVLLHCLLLSVFCWKLSMAIHLLLLVNRYPSDFLHASPPSWVFSVFSFGVPVILVAIVAGVKWDDYGPETFVWNKEHKYLGRWTYCWINPDSWVKWMFIGPVILITSVNLIILIFASMKYCSIKGSYAQGIYFKSMRGSLRFACSMVPILGLTWLIGCVLLIEKIDGTARLILEYIFIILNGLQGLFIFISIYFNEEVRLGLQMQKRGVVAPSQILDEEDYRDGTPIQISYQAD